MPIIGVIASSMKGAPGAPIIGTATDVGTARAYNNGAATVTFTPGAGATATSFTATSSPGGFTATGASSPLTVAGLQSGVSYTFTVTATNASGTSPASAASNSITATTVPQAPTIGTASDGGTGTTVSVAFTAGATGGKTVSTYTATSSPGSITGTNTVSPITVSGLTAGTAYTFTVTATNANGTSAASAASNSVTPALPTSFDSIQSSTPSGVSSVTFSNISTNYKHLQIRFSGLAASNSASNLIFMRPNDNSGTYRQKMVRADQTSGVAGDSGAENGAYLTYPINNNYINTTNPFISVMDIGEYQSTTMRQQAAGFMQQVNTGTSNSFTSYGGAPMASTAAITSIRIFSSATINFAAGTQISLYGIKG